jgi:hypothetical protein
VFLGVRHLNLMDKIRSNTISNEFESVIPKFQGLRDKGLELRGLGSGGLDRRGLEFESLVSNPRPGLGGSRPEMFLSFDFPRL